MQSIAGEKNPVVRLAVTSVSEGRSTVYMDLVGPGDVETRAANSINPDNYYLGRVGWWPDGSVMAQVGTQMEPAMQSVSQPMLSAISSLYIFFFLMCFWMPD